MHKNIKMSARAWPRVVQKTHAIGLELHHRSSQIRNLKSDVMQAFASLLNKLCDRRVRPGGFKQLDAGATGREHSHLHFFLFDGLAPPDREAKLLLVELERCLDGSHGDTEMVNFEKARRKAESVSDPAIDDRIRIAPSRGDFLGRGMKI